jgi:hypothetical protein
LYPHQGKEAVVGFVNAFNAMAQFANTVAYASFESSENL